MDQLTFNDTNFDAVIFDMDGVLIDSEPLWKIAMEQVFADVGCNLTRQDFQKTVGLRLDEVVEYWFNVIHWEGASAKDVEEAIVDRMVELITANGEPLVGVIETLEFLRAKNIKIGLATSSYSRLIETVLKVLNLNNTFSVTHSAENEKYGKPHPAVYLYVANHLNVRPENCLVIEDSFNGIVSAKAAKMKVVCIPEKTHHPDPRLIIADYQYETMQQLVNELKKQN